MLAATVGGELLRATEGEGSTMSADATQANVERVAQKAHEAVDRAAQTVSSGTDRVMNLQQEYGETARERSGAVSTSAAARDVGRNYRGKLDNQSVKQTPS
jgi:hypothetical protein